MIIFTYNVISVVDDVAAEVPSVHEDLEGKDTSVPEDLEGKDTSLPEDLEGKVTSVPEDVEGKDTSVPEDTEVEDSSVSAQHSANGETQQSVVPTIVNDIVVPDNSYSKYCFFFLMLLFALFVGRSFRKGV